MYWKASESIRCFKLNDLTQVGPWRNDYLLCSSFFHKLHVIDVQGKQELWECWSGNIWVPKEIDVYFVSLNQNIFSSTIKYILDLGYSFVSFIRMHCRFDEDTISQRQKVKSYCAKSYSSKKEVCKTNLELKGKFCPDKKTSWL